MASTGKFSCESCGKSYSWKPELAGKKAKCKCGQPLRVPETDPALDSLPDGFDDLAALGEGTVAEGSYAAAPADGPTCPSCSSPVDADAVICINCGHNLKTGKKLKTATAAAMAAPEYRSYAVTGGEEPMSPQKKKLIAFSIIGVLAVGIGVMLAITIPQTLRNKEQRRLEKQNAGPGVLEKVIENSDRAGGLVEAMKDGSLANGMRDKNKEKAAESLEQLRHRSRLNQRYTDFQKQKGPPARPWLQSGPKTRLYGFDHEKSLAFIKEMEDLGLTNILLIDQPSPSPPDEIVCYGVLAVLPDDAAKRKKIFDWYDAIPKMIELPDIHQDDIGQKYLSIELKD
jgi:hypothetical protein